MITGKWAFADLVNSKLGAAVNNLEGVPLKRTFRRWPSKYLLFHPQQREGWRYCHLDRFHGRGTLRKLFAISRQLEKPRRKRPALTREGEQIHRSVLINRISGLYALALLSKPIFDILPFNKCSFELPVRM
jgi:hypothetical protein